MLTLREPHCVDKLSVCMQERGVDELLSREWLLANSRGGYCSSTILGCNTRRYHGLLIGSLNPPVNRIMALSGCVEIINTASKSYSLSAYEFGGAFSPGDFGFIKQFRRDIGVHFDDSVGAIELTKSVYLLRDSDTVMLEYHFTKVPEPFEFVLRPLCGLRDFHSLQKSSAQFVSRDEDGGILVYDRNEHNCELFMHFGEADYHPEPQWWYDFIYRVDRGRGQDFSEDLWSPGIFSVKIENHCRIVFKAALRQRYDGETEAEGVKLDIKTVREILTRHRNKITAGVRNKDITLENLYIAADQFITRRRTDDSYRTTILAGFPWFADWGRDAFIALPGLLLCTGRFEEAKSVLTTFAAAADEGMIPNRFDDRSDTAYFNSIDASLWFINAAFAYLQTSGDSATFTNELLPTITSIMEHYQKGTRYGICADIDGLITAGSEQSQLTWMDARFDGVSFTPRYGKAVEINALWYNAICLMEWFYADTDAEKQSRYKMMTEKVGDSFRRLFWNEKLGYLNDCVFPDGTVDSSMRPNQIFAVSLPYSPLEKEQQKAVVAAVQKKLLTPYGLRSLDAGARGYKGIYTGSQRQRDGAYHQGTVWAYLIGPFVESYLKVNDFSRKSKREGREFIEPLLLHLMEEGCLGSVSEIFDGDAPHEPRGCFAQAWSVAELLRAYLMTKQPC